MVALATVTTPVPLIVCLSVIVLYKCSLHCPPFSLLSPFSILNYLTPQSDITAGLELPANLNAQTELKGLTNKVSPTVGPHYLQLT